MKPSSTLLPLNVLKKIKQKVWDLPVRLLHWGLAATVAAAWLTRNRLGPLHEYLGYATCAIVSARFVWGFAGNRYARFAQFARTVKPTWKYLQNVVAAKAPRYLGHNPLGGWMAIALLSCVAMLSVTGWLYTTDMFWGYGWLARLHAGLGWLLLIMIALHVAGMLFTSWQHRENLVAAMFSGDKTKPTGDDVA